MKEKNGTISYIIYAKSLGPSGYFRLISTYDAKLNTENIRQNMKGDSNQIIKEMLYISFVNNLFSNTV